MFFDLGYGVWNMELPSVGRSARFARSHTWEFLTPSFFWEVDTLASSLKCYHFRTCEGGKPPFNPLNCPLQRDYPHWLSPPPPGAVQTLWNNMSVGACFLPRKKITVKGASHGFATLPLTVIFLCGFTETPTEQNVQRACSRHEPTQGF